MTELDDTRCKSCQALLEQVRLLEKVRDAWRAQWACERDRAERAENALQRLRELTEEGTS